jgi:hypothetical protein
MVPLVLRLAALAALLFVAAPASASAALTASDLRIGAQPGFVRTVVDFTGGTVELNEADAVDPSPSDGDARVEIRHSGIRVSAGLDRRAFGVRARVSLVSASRARVQLTGEAGDFKYVRLSALHGPERLVIDLYRSVPPTPNAEIRVAPNRCLTLTSIQRTGTRYRVRGTELNLFEGSFVIRVRNEAGRVIGRKVVTARGTWDQTVSYSGVARRQLGTVEAVAASAKDGSLACLVQRRVTLVP